MCFFLVCVCVAGETFSCFVLISKTFFSDFPIFFYSNVQHEAEYKEILDAIKGSAKEKRLASQFIGKFFKFFPNLAETAIDAQLDLCEDEDIQVSEILINGKSKN